MLDEKEIEQKILNALKNTVRSEDDIDIKADLLEQGIIDSLDSIEFLFGLEKEFGIKIDDEDVQQDNLMSVSKLTQYISAKL